MANAASRFAPVLATLHGLIETDLAQLERQADAAGARGPPAVCPIGTRRREEKTDGLKLAPAPPAAPGDPR